MKLNKLTWSAAALMMLAFSCQRETPVENPNYDPETGTVNTQFVFSIASGDYQQTKQTAANTQATIAEKFRGFDEAYLVAYKQASDGKIVTSNVAAYDKWFTLGKIMASGSIDPDGDGTSVPQSRRVLELPITTGVNSMVFYARAAKSGTDAQQGKVTLVGSRENLSTVQGIGGPRLPATDDADYKLFTQSHQLMALVLNHILNYGINGTTGDPVAGVPLTITYGEESFSSALTWKDYAFDSEGNEQTTSPVKPAGGLTPLEGILKEAYTKLVTFTSGEVRAGSGSALAYTIGDLMSMLARVSGATVGTLQEEVARQMALKIRARIQQFFTGEGAACAWNDASSVISVLLTNAKAAVDPSDAGRFSELNAVSSQSDKANLNKFPLSFNIPAGAAVLSYDASGVTVDRAPAAYNKYNNFYYNFDTIDVSGMGMGSDKVGASHYLYPVELCYWGNSPIRTTTKASLVASDFPDGAGSWGSYNWAANDFTETHVKSNTTGVALEYNVHYATALLQSTVRYGAAKLNDNNGGLHTGEAANTIDVTTPGMFEFTGIIVGGQPNAVGWNFLPVSDASFNYMVYDGDVPDVAIPAYSSTATTLDSQPNYTMLFDNYQSTATPVYVGLEFKNKSGKNFWGLHNVIRNEGTFYIIGKLDPEAATSLTINADHHLPPYDSDGNSITTAKRVFIQSYLTEAHFVIGENSLQKAYVSVPDLRSTDIQLGLSVKLDWVKGVQFESVTLGE